MCHLILLLPLIALPVFWVWPLSWAVPTYALALLISGSTYYYAMAAMHRDISAGRESLAQARGKVVARSGAKLSVRVQGELWAASSDQDLNPGDAVEVIRVTGLTLKVQRRRSASSGALAHGGRHGAVH